jgi:hypothetical protein
LANLRNIVRNIIALALGVAALVLSGCNTGKHGVVGIRTDANGRHASTFIVESTGNEKYDEAAVYTASESFRRQVKKPLKNHRYNIPVVGNDIEPMYGTNKQPK